MWSSRVGGRSSGRLSRPCRCAVLAASGLILAFGFPAAAQEQPTRPTPPRDFAITNARVVTVSGPTIAEGTIVVRDGVIRAVGAEVAVPADAWVLDGTGLTVYPGLIDAFTTLGHPAGRADDDDDDSEADPGGPNAGGSGDAPEHSWGPEDRPATFTWLSAAHELDEEDDRIEEWREAGFTSAISTRGQGLFPGQAAVIDLAGERGREMVVAPSVAQRINIDAEGFDGYPGALLGVFAYIKQLYIDAQHYDQVWSAYEADPRGMPRPEYDRALEPLREPAPVLFPADNRKEILRAARTAAEVGAPVIVYGVQRGYEAVDVLSEGRTPVLIDLDWPKPPRDGDPEAEPDLETLRAWEHAATTPGLLEAAGVRFAFYSGGLDDPADVRENVRRAISLGLSPDAALSALTLAPAEIFGVADRMGSIEEGKIANLVLTDGDVFDAATEIRTVIVDGRTFDLFEPPESVADAEGEGDQQDEAEEEDEEDEDDEEDEYDWPSGPLIPMAELDGPYRDDPVTLIRDATILNGTDGAIEGGDVLIRDGRIAALAEEVDVPADAMVVDAAGMYLTPGIIDAHSHIAAESINEGSVNVSAMVGMKDVLDPDDVGIYRALAGGVTTINLLHGSANPIGGRNAVLKLRWGADGAELVFDAAPEGIKFALGENTKGDRDPDRYPSTRMGVQDVIRGAFLDAQAYMREWEVYETLRQENPAAIPPRRDLKLETLAEILRGERLVHAHSYRADEILQLMRLAEEFGFRIATFQHVLEGYKVADELAAHGAGASTFSDWWAYKVEAYDAIPHNAAIMTKRGVIVSINSDSGEEIRHLNQEAAKSMKWGGLSEVDALKLVTMNPAIQLGIDERVGSIEVGKDADVVLWQGHPLSMIGVAQQTYVDGKLYFDLELDRQRQAAVEEEKQALMEKHLPDRAAGARVVTDDDGPDPDDEEVGR